MATRPTYCTERDLKDVFPHIDDFDTKTPIYGWVKEHDGFPDADGDLWYSYNTGLISQLFVNGGKIAKGTFPTSASATIDSFPIGAESFTINETLTDEIQPLDILKIDNQYIKVTTINYGTRALTMTTESWRSLFQTNEVTHSDGTSVYNVWDASKFGVEPDVYSFVYDADLDLCILAVPDGIDPNDISVESGEDWDTLKTRYMLNASRYLDARLDPKLPRERIKDKDGNYDYIIVRSTALITAMFLIRANDPNSEIAKAMSEEVDGNIASLNGGEATLSWQVTQDSSHGIIREVGSPTAGLRPVDTRGEWSGTWDLIKLKITTAGALGTATYSVWTKDSTSGLKSNQVVTDKIITGDYQSLAGGLQIRFQGTDDSAVATLDDEWEVEVMGRDEEPDTGVRSSRNTRR